MSYLAAAAFSQWNVSSNSKWQKNWISSAFLGMFSSKAMSYAKSLPITGGYVNIWGHNCRNAKYTPKTAISIHIPSTAISPGKPLFGAFLSNSSGSWSENSIKVIGKVFLGFTHAASRCRCVFAAWRVCQLHCTKILNKQGPSWCVFIKSNVWR